MWPWPCQQPRKTTQWLVPPFLRNTCASCRTITNASMQQTGLRVNIDVLRLLEMKMSLQPLCAYAPCNIESREARSDFLRLWDRDIPSYGPGSTQRYISQLSTRHKISARLGEILLHLRCWPFPTLGCSSQQQLGGQSHPLAAGLLHSVGAGASY